MMNRTQAFTRDSFTPHLRKADDEQSVKSYVKSVRNATSAHKGEEQDF